MTEDDDLDIKSKKREYRLARKKIRQKCRLVLFGILACTIGHGSSKNIFKPSCCRVKNATAFEPWKAIIFGFLHLQKNDHIGRFRRQAEEENSIEWRNKGKND